MASGTKTLLEAIYQDLSARHGPLPNIRATQVQRLVRANTQGQYRSWDPWHPPPRTGVPFATLVVATPLPLSAFLADLR